MCVCGHAHLQHLQEGVKEKKNWAGEACGRNEYVFLFCAGLWQVPSDEDVRTGVSTSTQLSE